MKLDRELQNKILSECERSFSSGNRAGFIPIGKYGEFCSIYGEKKVIEALDFLVKEEYIFDNFRNNQTAKINSRKIEISPKGRLYISGK